MAKWLRRTLPFVGMPLCDLWGWLGSSGDFDYTWQPRLHFDGCLALGIRGIAVIGSCRTGPGTHPGTHLSRLLIFELATVNWLRRFATVAHPVSNPIHTEHFSAFGAGVEPAITLY